MNQLSVVLCCATCVSMLLVNESFAEKPFSPPTATEVFHLRSECAALGQKILDGNVVGPALYQDQISRYDPKTNRCYVELTVQTADTTKPSKYLAQYLYDGQTGELLAAIRTEGGQKWGMVYDRSHETKTLSNAGWDDAHAYINDMMTDDRKQ